MSTGAGPMLPFPLIDLMHSDEEMRQRVEVHRVQSSIRNYAADVSAQAG